MPAASDLKALNWPFKNPKFIFFTDFDGTITLEDSNDFMVSSLGNMNSRARLTDMSDR